MILCMSQTQLYISESLSTTRQTLLESFRWKLKFNLSSATLKSQLSRIKHCSTLAASPKSSSIYLHKSQDHVCLIVLCLRDEVQHLQFWHKIPLQISQDPSLPGCACFQHLFRWLTRCSRFVSLVNLCALPVLFVSFNSLSHKGPCGHMFMHCSCLLSKDKRTEKLTFVQICQRMQKMQKMQIYGLRAFRTELLPCHQVPITPQQCQRKAHEKVLQLLFPLLCAKNDITCDLSTSPQVNDFQSL